MARIQIMELPSEQVGPFKKIPFIFVIDRLERVGLKTHSGETVSSMSTSEWDYAEELAPELKAATGARGVVLFAGDLEAA